MFQLNDLARAIPESRSLGDTNVRWKNISIDSRTITPGDLFFALKGEKYDGHQFIGDVCKKGASGIVLEKNFYASHKSFFDACKSPLLLVENSLVALQQWARYYHSLYNPFDICITGSNGKTTTKEMIAHLLKLNYHLLKSQGNYNNEIGVPLTLLALKSHHNVLVMEMAAQKVGEIKELTNIVKPDIAVITNVGEAHIGLFGTKNNIAREKSEIIIALKENGTAILNRDDFYFDYFCERISPDIEVIDFGFHPKARVRAENIKQKKDSGIHFDLILEGNETHHVFIPLLGKFNVYNALAAICVAVKINIPVESIIRRIASFKGLHMHMEYRVFGRGITLVQDYYNANPTAMKEALSSVECISGGRFKVAVLGDMLELGDQTMDYHREVGRFAAQLSFNMIIGFGKYGIIIGQGAEKEGMKKENIYHFHGEDKEKLATHLEDTVPDNSIVLLKGSRNMQMEEIVRYWLEKVKTKGGSFHV